MFCWNYYSMLCLTLDSTDNTFRLKNDDLCICSVEIIILCLYCIPDTWQHCCSLKLPHSDQKIMTSAFCSLDIIILCLFYIPDTWHHWCKSHIKSKTMIPKILFRRDYCSMLTVCCISDTWQHWCKSHITSKKWWPIDLFCWDYYSMLCCIPDTWQHCCNSHIPTKKRLPLHLFCLDNYSMPMLHSRHLTALM